jgi:hypothetical protein
MCDDIEIIFTCAGSGTRWNNYNNTPKHLVDICGKPLLQSNIEKFDALFNLKKYIVSIDSGDKKDVYNVHEKIDFYIMNEENNINHPALYNLKNYIMKSKKNTLVVLGDVCFSDESVKNIYELVKKEEYQVFGRIGKSKICNYGELFAFYIPNIDKYDFYLSAEVAKMFFDKKILSRFTGWEIILFIESSGGINNICNINKNDFDIIVKKISIFLKVIYSENCGVIKIKNFYQINDSTEDFDFPEDYIKWKKYHIQNKN